MVKSKTQNSSTASRKDRRKEERENRKKRKRNHFSAGGRGGPNDENPNDNDYKTTAVGKDDNKSKDPEKKTRKITEDGNHEYSKEKSTTKSKKKQPVSKDPYAHLDPDVAAAMRRDDEEIRDLEAKLGINKKKEKNRLKKEYHKLEGYGDDFVDFLDDLDALTDRLTSKDASDYNQSLLDHSHSEDDEFDESEDDVAEELVPMKSPVYDDMESDDSVLEELEAEEGNEQNGPSAPEADQPPQDVNSNHSSDESKSASEEESDGDHSSAGESDQEADEAVTYRPSKGEDIYGKKLDSSSGDGETKAYVPPHMRNKERSTDEGQKQQEVLRQIQMNLNRAFNRLSEDTVVSVAQSVAQLYSSFPVTDVNNSVWKNTRDACVSSNMTSVALIPLYVAAITGVHLQKSDSAQLGEFVLEKAVQELLQERECTAQSQSNDTDNESDDGLIGDKKACNLLLILCYMYNFGVVHCALMYELIRELINGFTELDVELLLLILLHSGRTLRSDDPSSLKEIVLLVQEKAADRSGTSASSSRVEFMISTITDLKNNKRRKQDQVHAEKTSRLRKMLGQVKSLVMSTRTGTRASDSSLRLSLDDIKNVETKGRWWKVGASWVGNQFSYREKKGDGHSGNDSKSASTYSTLEEEQDEKLLKLAAKYRMNTDSRRSVFCIIMGSEDCDDAFEKLVRAGMLKNRTERDSVRVLMECCGNEKTYNKFYSHLAARLCDFQPQCRFTFQLAYWDLFKQFEDMKVRKAANLAKLLFHLVAVHDVLHLSVIKSIDMSSPEQLPEGAVIFLTIFLSSILEYFEDSGAARQWFERSVAPRRKKGSSPGDLLGGEDQLESGDDREALRANLTVFLVQILKSSPKYKKGSKFRSNLKAAVKACDSDNFLM